MHLSYWSRRRGLYTIVRQTVESTSQTVLPKGDQLVVVCKHRTVDIVRGDVVARQTACLGQRLEQAGDIGRLVEGLAQVEFVHDAIHTSLGKSAILSQVVGEKKREKNEPSFCGLA